MAVAAATATRPHLIQLRRESVPVRRKGRVVSFKTSYSGPIRVGQPAQEFRVVFDTGSGHVVLPAVECQSEACLAHRRYNAVASETASAINLDGSPVRPGELCDQVSIGFGTGEVTGEFVKERVCLGSAEPALPADAGLQLQTAPCVDMHVVSAVQMSPQPFKSFKFDGILGLGLDSLSLSPSFSFFAWLSGSDRIGAAQFAAFLTEGEDGEASEIAFGGHNPVRTLEPLSWTPVASPELGYWAIKIIAIRVNGMMLDICRDGTCRGVVDTGSSHLGIPTPHDREIAALLTQTANDILDCRLVDGPMVEIEIPGRNLSLLPENYMRRMPLREDVKIGSSSGVSLAWSSRETPQRGEDSPAPGAASVLKNERRLRSGAVGTSAAQANDALQRYCRPRLMPVNLPAPLGPNVFILGEPLLHRYYTVFDWKAKQLGFALAASRRNILSMRRSSG